MKTHCCDQCGKLIKDKDIRITINGFSVLQNQESNRFPKGFQVEKPEDFCSFQCLANWALEAQQMLDEYIKIASKFEEVSHHKS